MKKFIWWILTPIHIVVLAIFFAAWAFTDFVDDDKPINGFERILNTLIAWPFRLEANK